MQAYKGIHAVVVGNLGTVYLGDSEIIANRFYAHYYEASKAPHGRASGEPVTQFAGDKITREYVPEVTR